MQYYANSHYAQVAGVSLRELNAMELDLLFRLDFRWASGGTGCVLDGSVRFAGLSPRS